MPQSESAARSEKEANGAPVIHYEADGCVMATWRNFAVVVWGTQGTMSLIRELDVMSRPFVLAHPEGISCLHVILEGVKLPESEAREGFRKMTVTYGANIACFSTVVDGQGFWASAMRSFLTGLQWIGRNPLRAHYAASISEQARWVHALHAERTGTRVSATEIARVVTSLRDRVR